MTVEDKISFEINPNRGCDFLLFDEKRENIRQMLDNKYTLSKTQENVDFYNVFSLEFKDDRLVCIEFFDDENLQVMFNGKNINNILFKEAYYYIKKYDKDIKLIKDFNCAISLKYGIIISGTYNDNYFDNNVCCIDVIKNGYITLDDFKL